MLKLKVCACAGMNWLNNALVEVGIYRQGSGQVDSDSGYTNSTGYIEFDFSNLEDLDEAHVTVTPSGQNPDSGHIYTWHAAGERAGGYWSINDETEDVCADTWYDEKENIIQCVYS